MWKRRLPYVHLLVYRAYHHPHLHDMPLRFQKIHTEYMDVYRDYLHNYALNHVDPLYLGRMYQVHVVLSALQPGNCWSLKLKSHFNALWSVLKITLYPYKSCLRYLQVKSTASTSFRVSPI